MSYPSSFGPSSPFAFEFRSDFFVAFLQMPTTRDLPPRPAPARAAGLADETIEAIAAEVPDYARAMEGAFGAAVRRGVEIAFERFLAVEDPTRTRLARGVRRARARRVPRRAAASTRCSPPTASARGWRGGGSWRRAARPASRPRCSTTSARRSSPTSTRSPPSRPTATPQEQSAAAGETQRRRRRLVRLLAEDPPASEEALRTAAGGRGLAAAAAGRRAGARAAETRAGAAAGATGARAGRARRRGGGARAAARRRRRRGRVRRPRLRVRARSRTPPAAAASSRRRSARQRAALGPAGRVARGRREPAPRRGAALALEVPGPLVVADEHLATLLLTADPALGDELAAHPAGAARGALRHPARADDRDAARPGSTARARCRPSPPRSACTRRPCATASTACASCSGSASRTPTRASSSRSRSGWRRRASNRQRACACS